MGSSPWGPEKYPLRHVVFPERHNLSESNHIEARNCFEVRGCREAVRARSHDHYIAIVHAKIPRFRISAVIDIVSRIEPTPITGSLKVEASSRYTFAFCRSPC